MAQPYTELAAQPPDPLSSSNGQVSQSRWRRFFAAVGKDNGADGSSLAQNSQNLEQQQPQQQPQQSGQHDDDDGKDDDSKTGIIQRVSRKVVPGLPRTQTFKRQRSEVRSRLEAVLPSAAERRAVSVDRRLQDNAAALNNSDPRASAPDFIHHFLSSPPSPRYPMSPLEDLGHDDFTMDRDSVTDRFTHESDGPSKQEIQSMTNSQYDALIEGELERKWILNLSMHFRDKSKREKFFVTFRQHAHHWRRVTVSLDYRDAPKDSLEAELSGPLLQRDKSEKIYMAIRDSLAEIDFYETVTNLKLETKEGRLHVHVVEDVNEIITYPPVRMVQHMDCRRVKEREIHFDSHMSGFVYRVRVHGQLLVKKEIPGPDTVDEFLYEINALNQLCGSRHVIQFYGVVVDDTDDNITGLLISYASQGPLIDVIFDNQPSLSWPRRERWARQIVSGLSEIHEAGFVQGDFTLSNIVIDGNDNAKIIDINRRGCPIGWEPPEVTPLVESNQRISMYIGVKSDLYQLGMVLWALAMQRDEPDAAGRPLTIPTDVPVPAWYREVVGICLNPDPKERLQAGKLLAWFPELDDTMQNGGPAAELTLSLTRRDNPRPEYLSPPGVPRIRTVRPPDDWTYMGWGNHHPAAEEPFYYSSRGRSPPSPMPSNHGDYDSGRFPPRMYAWSADGYNRMPAVPSVSDVLLKGSRGGSEAGYGEDEGGHGETYADAPYRFRGAAAAADVSGDDESYVSRGRSRPRRRVTAATYDDQSSVQASTWGMMSDHWQSTADGKGGQHNTGRASQADSGKDFTTERASTPREYRSYDGESRERSVSRGRRRRSTIESVSGMGARQAKAMASVATMTTEQSAHAPSFGTSNTFNHTDSQTDDTEDEGEDMDRDEDKTMHIPAKTSRGQASAKETTALVSSTPTPATMAAVASQQGTTPQQTNSNSMTTTTTLPPPPVVPTTALSQPRRSSDEDLKGVGSAYDPDTLGPHITGNNRNSIGNYHQRHCQKNSSYNENKQRQHADTDLDMVMEMDIDRDLDLNSDLDLDSDLASELDQELKALGSDMDLDLGLGLKEDFGKGLGKGKGKGRDTKVAA
ncbi:uncharacterized protein C8A04DRAFT_26345 [Dichotomopilus funicola]|uniref:Protein kinase domain-containing protein n=1 Tax=Dichotomopilus funicola TaxID=1934379 RepID=A0AAN6V7H3_9PEZI|nr:hypothetical protein C8A04DRAFT_26345 [Dichotomopilus funicola]